MRRLVLVTVLAACLGAGVNMAEAALATKIRIYVFPVSLPDTTVPIFGTARDNLLTRMQMGEGLSTGSRHGHPGALEIRSSFDCGDFTVCPQNVEMWRAVFNPGGAYVGMHGQRVYFAVVIVGVDGQVSLDRIDYRITSSVGLMSNQSGTLNLLDYSVSRRGVLNNTGELFDGNDTFVTSGPGSQLVDAVVYIGGRIGVQVANQADLIALGDQLSAAGEWALCQYTFRGNTTTNGGYCGIALFDKGNIPSSLNKWSHFFTPKGILFSVEGPENTPQFLVESTRIYGTSYTLFSNQAREGISVYFGFDEPKGFIQSPWPFPIGTGAGGSASFSLANSSFGSTVLTLDPGTELDQDR